MGIQMMDDGFIPVTRSRNLANYLRDDLDELRDVKVSSDLDRHIVHLLALNPSLKVRFRNQDLTVLNDATKLDLLKDFNDVLGIGDLKSPVQ